MKKSISEIQQTLKELEQNDEQIKNAPSIIKQQKKASKRYTSILSRLKKIEKFDESKIQPAKLSDAELRL